MRGPGLGSSGLFFHGVTEFRINGKREAPQSATIAASGDPSVLTCQARCADPARFPARSSHTEALPNLQVDSHLPTAIFSNE
jgi:hypothetical protein